jgi:hypothetical protein
MNETESQVTLTRRDTLLLATTLAAASTMGLGSPVGIAPSPAQAASNIPVGGSQYTFERGYPTKDATQRARDDMDYQRAIVAYHFWYPTVSLEGFFSGNRQAGIADNQALPLAQCTPHWVAFTGNSDTPYAIGVLDVKEGPMVIELPAGPFVSLVNDHHQRWVVDMGIPGTDAGKGGKFIILPPDYRGEPPVGYKAARSSTFKTLWILRSIPQNGDVNAAIQAAQTIKVYPLSDPTKVLKYVDVTGKDIAGSSVPWEDNIQYWRKLHEVLDYEPVLDEFRAMYGVLSQLGIERGKPFDPDTRMKAILERAARDGKGQMLAASFDSPRPDRIVWTDRRWEWAGFVWDNGNFHTPSGIDQEGRDRWFMQALAGSPAMFNRSPNAGSLYWLGVRDKDGNWLDGGKMYKLTVPQPVPARLFWSVTVYDPETRSQVVTDQDKAALRSLFELKDVSTAIPTELYFGPRAPTGQEDRWIKTIPGKGWFTYFRVYGPQDLAFDGSWRPGDFERV